MCPQEGQVRCLHLPGAGEAHAEDYGHADLVLGRRAPDETFPLVEAFLSSHATHV